MIFENQVAIVTGAGGGIGRSIALLLAGLGARIVVNDAGCDPHGTHASLTRAETVADEIRSSGGIATANLEFIGSVDAAERVREAALQAFGRIDILINNAAIMATGDVSAIDDATVDRVIEVNLMGSYRLIRALWPVMKAQSYGRILNMSSSSLLGFGDRSPYATSKAGIIGLTADVAIAGKPHGIIVNSLLPAASTRLTNGEAGGVDVLDAEVLAWLSATFPAEKVAPAAAYLVSRNVGVVGQHIVAGGDRVARLAHFETMGWRSPTMTVEDIAAQIDIVTDTTHGAFVSSGPDSLLLADVDGNLQVKLLSGSANGRADRVHDVSANKRIARTFVEAMSESDFEKFESVIGDDIVMHTMGSCILSLRRDRSNLASAYATVLAGCPDGVSLEIKSITAEDDRVSVEVQGRARTVSGQAYDNQYHFMFIIRHGKIREMREYMDTRLVEEIFSPIVVKNPSLLI